MSLFKREITDDQMTDMFNKYFEYFKNTNLQIGWGPGYLYVNVNGKSSNEVLFNRYYIEDAEKALRICLKQLNLDLIGFDKLYNSPMWKVLHGA